MLALALGMLSGGVLSAAGWFLSGAFLLVVALSGSVDAGLPLLVAMSAVAAVVFAFNAGLCIGLVPRAIAAGRAPVN